MQTQFTNQARESAGAANPVRVPEVDARVRHELALNALTEVQDRNARVRSGALGLLLSLGLGAGLVVASDHIEPARRLLSEVIPMHMIGEPVRPPPPSDEPTPPPQQPLPTPRRPPSTRAVSSPQPVATPTQLPPPSPDQRAADTVGLDSSSFGTGTGGPAFYAGTTQMGTPGHRPAPAFAPAPRPMTPVQRASSGVSVEAHGRFGNAVPPYPESVRSRNVEGLMVIETDIDASGHVTRAVVRRKLDPELDAAAVQTVKSWSFEPATAEGKPVASTKFVRVRFRLE